MNPNEHELEYPPFELPAIGTATLLRPGIYWLRMPLPFVLNHINLWLLEDEIEGQAGWTVVDCGVSTDETRAAWEKLFDTVFEGRPILRVISTHFHPDHFGLAYWLTNGGDAVRWNAPLWMTHGEYTFGRLMSLGRGDEGDQAMAAHFVRHGLPQADAQGMLRERGGGRYPKLVPAVPPQFRRIVEGQEILIGPASAKRSFRVIIGYGHAPEHVSLFCESEKLLIAGDMVLPRISTNISVFDIEPEGNPLPAYLQSLQSYQALPDDTLVLPSHGLPFIGLHARIRQQQNHHADHLAEVLAACATPKSAADIVPLMFKRQLDMNQLGFALGEALAHLHALWHEAKVRRSFDGETYRFEAD